MVKRLFALTFVLVAFAATQAVAIEENMAAISSKIICLWPHTQGTDISDERLLELYEKSNVNYVPVFVDWSKIEPKAPVGDQRNLDFSCVVNQPLFKSDKHKLFILDLENEWADKIYEKDKEKYSEMVAGLVDLVLDNTTETIDMFFYMKRLPGDLASYVGKMDAVYDALNADELLVESLVEKKDGTGDEAKKAEKQLEELGYIGDRRLIVEAPGITDTQLQELYDAGARGNFDVLSIEIPYSAYMENTGIDIYKVRPVIWAMEKNNDKGRKLFIKSGWGVILADNVNGPQKTNILRDTITSGLRNLFTERDIWSSLSVAGAAFPLNDFEIVSEDMDASVVRGVVTSSGEPRDGLLENFIPDTADHSYSAYLKGKEGEISLIAGEKYRMDTVFHNYEKDDIELGSFSVRAVYLPAGNTLWGNTPVMDMKLEPVGDTPKVAPSAKDTTIAFDIVLPEMANEKNVKIIAEGTYTKNGKEYYTDAWLHVRPVTSVSVNMMPTRVIVKPDSSETVFGVSVINNTASEQKGSIDLKATRGLGLSEDSFSYELAPRDLEGNTFKLTAEENLAPGHYTVTAYLNKLNMNWIMVDIPLQAQKASVSPDGKANEWMGAQKVDIGISRQSAMDDPRPGYVDFGSFMAAYDENALYIAVAAIDKDHFPYDGGEGDYVEIQIDTLLDGARTAEGGLKPDDYELMVYDDGKKCVAEMTVTAEAADKEAVKALEAGCVNKDGQTFYEVRVPWAALAPYNLKSGRMFSVGVKVADMQRDMSYQYGYSSSPVKSDPRTFIPIYLKK